LLEIYSEIIKDIPIEKFKNLKVGKKFIATSVLRDGMEFCGAWYPVGKRPAPILIKINQVAEEINAIRLFDGLHIAIPDEMLVIPLK